MHQMQIRGQLRWHRELTIVFVKEELVSGSSEEEMGVLFLVLFLVWCSLYSEILSLKKALGNV